MEFYCHLHTGPFIINCILAATLGVQWLSAGWCSEDQMITVMMASCHSAGVVMRHWSYPQYRHFRKPWRMFIIRARLCRIFPGDGAYNKTNFVRNMKVWKFCFMCHNVLHNSIQLFINLNLHNKQQSFLIFLPSFHSLCCIVFYIPFTGL